MCFQEKINYKNWKKVKKWKKMEETNNIVVKIKKKREKQRK